MPTDCRAVKRTTKNRQLQVHKIYNDHEKIYHHYPCSFIHRRYFFL
jgi:hypothetical protein